MLRAFLRGLADLLYPPACVVCTRPLLAAGPDLPDFPATDFCSECEQALTHDPHQVCPRCAATVGPHALVDGDCTHCRGEKFIFASVLRMGVYEGLLRGQVLRAKFGGDEGLAELLGELWATHARGVFDALKIDLIVPLPLHWSRRLQRGFNQSEAVARGLAHRLSIPVNPAALKRTRRTAQQANQPASLRRDNVRGAFRCPKPSILRNRTVLLVDDVLTSGATANEASRALAAGGAGRIIVAALARADGADAW